MSQRVSLSRRDAQVLRDLIESTEEARVRMSAIEHRAVASLRSALSPRPKKPMRREREKAQAQKKATKRERRASVREQVMARADGVCECGCGRALIEGHFLADPHMDHFFGRARAESVETCWALRAACDTARTHNRPNAEHWQRKFISHCDMHGYRAAAERTRALMESDQLSRASAEAGRTR